MYRLMNAAFHAQPACPLRDLLRIAVSTGISLVLAGEVPALLQGHVAGTPWLLGSMGASALMMAAFPRSPYGRPYAVVVGNVLAAAAAMAWLQVPVPAAIIAGLAVATAILAMSVARAFHPPSAGLALILAMEGLPTVVPGWQFLLVSVFAGSLVLVAVSHAVRAVSRALGNDAGA